MENKNLVIGLTVNDDAINKLATSFKILEEYINVDFMVTNKSISPLCIDNIAAEINYVDQPNIIDKISEIIIKEGTDIDQFGNYFWFCLSKTQYDCCKRLYFKGMTIGQARIKVLNTCDLIVPYYGNGNDLVYIDPSCWADYELETSYQVKRLFDENTGTSISLKLAYYIWSYVSNEVYASWLGHEDDSDAWARIIGFFILKGDHVKEGK